jgi:hypothetical protein
LYHRHPPVASIQINKFTSTNPMWNFGERQGVREKSGLMTNKKGAR